MTQSTGVGDALKKLGFKVYDFQAASNRYERDFPLWLEAARLRSEGRPYNQSDYDKIIGDHNALVGAPTCFFDYEFVKLYPSVKIILVTRESDTTTVAKMLEKVASHFWQYVDPVYYNSVTQFIKLVCKPDVDHQLIRGAVRDRNLLEIQNLIAWLPLCTFLGVPVPDGPAPELHDNTIQLELSAHTQSAFSKKAKQISWRIYKVVSYSAGFAAATTVSLIVTTFGIWNLHKASSAVNYLIELSQYRDITRLFAVGMAVFALVCGLVAGYSLATVRRSNTTVTMLPSCGQQRRSRDGRNNDKMGRGRSSNNDQNTRPERPVLPSWNGVQEDIRRDDAEMVIEGRATLEEWKNDKHVTFNVTHKLTESGQAVFSGPRKVVSITEEKVE